MKVKIADSFGRDGGELMARVDLSSRAELDLVEIGTFIFGQSGSRETADRLLDRIDEKCRLLATQPESGQSRPEFATGKYRSSIAGNYVIYYLPTNDGIIVARILHGSRDHNALL